MNNPHIAQEQWLKKYYFVRAAFSIAWVAAAFSVGGHSAALAAALLICYPAWDAMANLADGSHSGGLASNRTQALNVFASLVVAAAVGFVLPEMHQVLAVFGAWAVLSGLLQLGTALRRWKSFGAQWAMVLSGAQSALAGAVFIIQAGKPEEPSIITVAGYAGFGAFYFLVSALSLSFKAMRSKQV